MSFIARRLALVYFVVYGPKDSVFQMMILIGLAILSEVLVYQTKALESIAQRRMGTFNELFMMQVCYNFICFNIVDVETNFAIGYASIAIVGLYILFCLLVILYGSFTAGKLRVRKCCARRYHRR